MPRSHASSNAENQRRYRARPKEDPVIYEQALQKERQRWHQRRENHHIHDRAWEASNKKNKKKEELQAWEDPSLLDLFASPFTSTHASASAESDATLNDTLSSEASTSILNSSQGSVSDIQDSQDIVSSANSIKASATGKNKPNQWTWPFPHDMFISFFTTMVNSHRFSL